MRRHVIVIALAAFLAALSTAAFCQKHNEAGPGRGPGMHGPAGMERPEKGLEPEIRRRHEQLEMKKRETELQFHREMRKLELEKKRIELGHKRQAFKYKADKHRKKGGALFLFVCFIIHILLTVWVYQDIRKRNSGSGIWIAITLLSGFFGALLYAIVRLGDMRQQKS